MKAIAQSAQNTLRIPPDVIRVHDGRSDAVIEGPELTKHLRIMDIRWESLRLRAKEEGTSVEKW